MGQHLSFLSSLIQRIGMNRTKKELAGAESLIALCHQLLSNNSDAMLFSLAKTILDDFVSLSEDQKNTFFLLFLNQFSANKSELIESLKTLNVDNEEQVRLLHKLAEPKTHDVLRKLNQAPNGTSVLLNMRVALIDAVKKDPSLRPLDDDFLYLFSSWFNRGFLRLERIDWSTSAEVLEKIMKYEAVHDISDWDDLHNRVAAPDKRLYAFFHPALPSEPLIFIEVVLANEIPSSIMSILQKDEVLTDPLGAKTAAFYSISNCQIGLKNVSFGSFLIKQVVAELEQEFKNIEQFVTLSPVPGLKKWAQDVLHLDKKPPESIVKDIKDCLEGDTHEEISLIRLALYYITQEKRKSGHAFNQVAHFHLSNGASLHQVHVGANTNKKALEDSWGVMVNYLYDPQTVAQNHENYANLEPIAMSGNLMKIIQSNKRKILAYSS